MKQTAEMYVKADGSGKPTAHSGFAEEAAVGGRGREGVKMSGGIWSRIFIAL